MGGGGGFGRGKKPNFCMAAFTSPLDSLVDATILFANTADYLIKQWKLNVTQEEFEQ